MLKASLITLALVFGIVAGLLSGYMAMNQYVSPNYVLPTWRAPFENKFGPEQLTSKGTVLSVSPDGKHVVVSVRSPYLSNSKINNTYVLKITDHTVIREANGNVIDGGVSKLNRGDAVSVFINRGEGELGAFMIVLN